MKYLLGIFFGNIAFVVVANALVQPTTSNASVINVEMIGLIIVAIIGALWIYKVTGQVKKFNEELSTYLEPCVPPLKD